MGKDLWFFVAACG